MQPRLQEILSRLVASDVTPLSGEERAYVASLLEPRPPAEAPLKRPLWAWVREGLARWNWPFLGIPCKGEFTDALAPVLIDAGARGERYETTLARWRAEVSLDDLRRSILRHLVIDLPGELPTTRAEAALVAGLAGLSEVAPVLAEALQASRRGERGWSDDEQQAALSALLMLDAPALDALVPAYLAHENASVSRVALVRCLMRPGVVDDATLAAHLPLDPVLLEVFPAGYMRAVRAGFPFRERLDPFIENNSINILTARAIAEVALGCELRETIEMLLRASSDELRSAMIVELGAAAASWAAELLRGRLADETNDNIRVLLTASIGAAGSAPASWFQDQLASSAWNDRCGAVLAGLGRRGLDALLEPRRTDDSTYVSQAASMVLALNAPDPCATVIEFTSQKFLGSGIFWVLYWPVRRLEVLGWPLPPAGRALRCLNLLDPLGAYDTLRDLLSLSPHTPLQTSDDPIRSRLITAQATLGGAFLALLESSMINDPPSVQQTQLIAELACAGGCRTTLGRVKERLLLGNLERGNTDEEHGVLALVLALASGDDGAQATALGALSGPLAEPLFAYMLHRKSGDQAMQKALAQAMRLDAVSDPLLVELRRLIGKEARRLDDVLTLTFSPPDASTQLQLTHLAAHPSSSPRFARSFLLEQLDSSDSDVACVALQGLLAHEGDGTAQRLLLEASCQPGWRLRQEAARMLGERGTLPAVARLCAMLSDSDNDVQQTAAEALRRVLLRHPSAGLLVFDVSSPGRVKEWYGLTEDIDDSNDARVEALRLMLTALDQRKDAALARRHLGRKLLLTRLPPGQPAQVGSRPLPLPDFEALAIFLRVTYADDESGAVVAEVTDEPSGEILNATLLTDSVVLLTTTWS